MENILVKRMNVHRLASICNTVHQTHCKHNMQSNIIMFSEPRCTPEFGPSSLARICCSLRSSFICLRLLITISGLEMLRVKLESGAASYRRLAMFSLLLASCFCASFSRFFSSFFSRFDSRRSRSGAGAVVLVVSPRPLHYVRQLHNIYSLSHCNICNKQKTSWKVHNRTL